jgi:hypothetical protein
MFYEFSFFFLMLNDSYDSIPAHVRQTRNVVVEMMFFFVASQLLQELFVMSLSYCLFLASRHIIH